MSKNQTPVDYAVDPHLTPQVKAFLDVLNASDTPVESLSTEDARNVLVNAQKAAKVDKSGVTVEEKTITADGYTVKLHIMKPEGATGTLPVFMFIHGGGWILGDFPTHQRLMRDLVVLSGFASVFVNYTRTPDAAYPQAINEIYAATKWVAENGAEIGVDGKNMAIAGNSVGGNMSTVTTILAKERGGPKIKFQLLMWPIVDADFDTKSYRKFGTQRFLTKSLMSWMYDMYIPDPEKRKDIHASPLQATVEQLKGLPPALIQVAENDILRDEGEAYGRKLAEAGVTVTTIRYIGVIHDWGMLDGLAHLPETRSLVEHGAAELKKYLG
ncbi:alpha/beta hydrolase [Chitinophaga barathri]|uniref:Alpha/beta hydrolase n=1 Tax=Chitinophaga barathri TaxID=1647451 RepID=A0A3N4MLE5_9BACT|nr:alpha/beta hydrolase [Chitinophaga barathri]RPD42886.1 alpha/beta hydrolase [Chitinophaga barathri]